MPVYDLKGIKVGKIVAPKEIIDNKINKSLIAQSIRVYLANHHKGFASTKTRGEVEGSTRKIYRQKGTGRARHGAIRAPIFVGGGITFGPKPRDYRLDLPKKMKKLALKMALKSRFDDGSITVLAGLTTTPPKTKIVATALRAVGAYGRTLLIVTKESKNAILAARNIRFLDILPVNEINTYQILSHQKLVFAKETIPLLREMFTK